MKTISEKNLQLAKKFHVVIQETEIGIFDKRIVWKVSDPLKRHLSELTYSQSNKELEGAIKIVAEKAGHLTISQSGRTINPLSKEVSNFLEEKRKRITDLQKELSIARLKVRNAKTGKDLQSANFDVEQLLKKIESETIE